MRGDRLTSSSWPASTNLTGYSHGFAFGASANGAAFGRYVISTGEEQFTANTDPKDPASYLEASVAPDQGRTVAITFQAQPKRGYEVLAADNLSSSLWQTLAAIPASLDARWVRVAVGSAGPARFFRVVVAPLSNP